MPQTIDIPDLGVVDFPDEMSSEEIAAAARKLYEKAPVTPSLRPVLSLPEDPGRVGEPGAYQQALGHVEGPRADTAQPIYGPIPEAPGIFSPYVPIPEAPRFTNQEDVPYGAYPSMLASSLWNKIVKPTAEFVESPGGTGAGMIAGMGPLASRLVGAGFVGDMTYHLPEVARRAGYTSVMGTPQEKLDAAAELAMQAYVPLHAGYGAFRPGLQADVEQQARNFDLQPFSQDVEIAARQGGQPQRQLGFRLMDALNDPSIKPLIEQALQETTPVGRIVKPGQPRALGDLQELAYPEDYPPGATLVPGGEATRLKPPSEWSALQEPLAFTPSTKPGEMPTAQEVAFPRQDYLTKPLTPEPKEVPSAIRLRTDQRQLREEGLPVEGSEEARGANLQRQQAGQKEPGLSGVQGQGKVEEPWYEGRDKFLGDRPATPAVRAPSGEIIEGNSHQDAHNKAVEAGKIKTATEDVEWGWIGEDNKFYPYDDIFSTPIPKSLKKGQESGEAAKPPVQPSGTQGVATEQPKGLSVKAAQEKAARERGQTGAIQPEGSERRQAELWNKLLEKVKGLKGMTGLPDLAPPLDLERMTERPEGLEAVRRWPADEFGIESFPGWPVVVSRLNDEQLANMAGHAEVALIDAERSGSPDAADYQHILGRVTGELNRRNLPTPFRPGGVAQGENVGPSEGKQDVEEPKQPGITIPQPEEGWVSAFDRRKRSQEGSFVLPGPELMRAASGFKRTATIAGQQLLNRVRNLLHPDEFKSYEDRGLRTFLARPRTPEDVAKWMERNGPKVEVHAYGMEGKVSEAKQEYDQMTHEWYDRLTPEQKIEVKKVTTGLYEDSTRPLWEKFITEYGNDFFQKAQKYSELAFAQQKETMSPGPRATSAYENVSAFDTREPMPEWTKTKGGRNLQRVDVTVGIPIGYGKGASRGVLWPTDERKVHEQFPNTLGWAAIQYKTGPRGEKMAVIGEVQSRWGQARRQREADPMEVFNSSNEESIPSHPLLNDYNRLVLKAAIDQAVKEGATHIVLPDAETAMMTEHQDQHSTITNPEGEHNVKDLTGFKIDNFQGHPNDTVTLTGKVRVLDSKYQFARQLETTNRGWINLRQTQIQPDWLLKHLPMERTIDQEGGMRLNYDKVLPKIAEELTGSKGEPVDLGDHKNAFEYENKATGRRSDQPMEGEGRWVAKEREDLVFKNPDGSPKTSVTGRSYDLAKVKQRTEPFKLFGSDKLSEQKIGGIKIPEPGSKGREAGAISTKPLEDAWEKMSALAKSVPVKERVAQLLDAAENAARIFGRQHGNELRVMLPKPIQQDALTFVLGTRGDRGRLANMLTIIGNKSPKATRAIQYAQRNWAELQPAANRAIQMVAVQRFCEQHSGVQTINHYELMYDPRGTGVSSPNFKTEKYYPNMADAIANEKVPPNFNAADLIERRLAIGMKRMNRIKWVEAFGAMKDPGTGDPLVKPMIKDPAFGHAVAPAGYETREVYGGIRIAVKKEYTDIIDSLIQPSAIRSNKFGRLVLNSEAKLKHGLLLFDSFHLSRVLQKQVFLTGFKKMGDPRSLLEYNRRTVEMLVNKGDMPRSALASYDTLQPRVQLLVRNGLNVGRIAEGLYADVIRRPWRIKGKDVNIPSIFNKWVFEKVSRSAMLNSAMIEYDRTKANNPTWSEDKVASHVAKQVNIYYGNLMRQGLLKSATLRDIAQATLLAPQWFESMAQTELRAYYQTAKVPYDAAFERALKIGTLAKGVGRGLFAYMIGTQLINLGTRGHLTFQNPEKEHKLDAWIPDPTGKTGGFFLSPFSVVAEITHDWFRYSQVKKNQMEVAAQILKNKSSPLERSIQIFFSGRDYTGAKILESKDVLKDSAKALIPTPLPISGAFSETPGQGMRQLFSTAGVKVEPSSRQTFLLDKKAQEIYKTDFNQLPIPERMSVARQVEKEPLPLQQRYSIAQRATDKEFQRQADIRNSLPSNIQAFVKKNGLTISAPEPNIIRRGTSVSFNDAEKEALQKSAVLHYIEALEPLIGNKEFEELPQKRKQVIVDHRLDHAKERARRKILSGAVH